MIRSTSAPLHQGVERLQLLRRPRRRGAGSGSSPAGSGGPRSATSCNARRRRRGRPARPGGRRRRRRSRRGPPSGRRTSWRRSRSRALATSWATEGFSQMMRDRAWRRRLAPAPADPSSALPADRGLRARDDLLDALPDPLGHGLQLAHGLVQGDVNDPARRAARPCGRSLPRPPARRPASPKRVARTRSNAMGVPPRWTWPSTTGRASAPIASEIRSARVSATPALASWAWPNSSTSPSPRLPSSVDPLADDHDRVAAPALAPARDALADRLDRRAAARG